MIYNLSPDTQFENFVFIHRYGGAQSGHQLQGNAIKWKQKKNLRPSRHKHE